MIDDITPTWGCPWHGLIKGGELTTANGVKMPMRQPAGARNWERSSTHLIDLGVPAIPNTIDGSGKLWLNKLLLSGDQIHGVSIGTGAWIYQAPDKSNWRASTTLHNSDGFGSFKTIVLDKFGDFSGAPESYTYTFGVPDLGPARSYAGSPFVDGEVKMFSVKKDGSAAIFVYDAEFLFSEACRPIAWLELKISGPASDAAVSVNMVRDEVETAGVYANNNVDPVSIMTYGVSGKWSISDDTIDDHPDCSGKYTAEKSYVLEDSGDIIYSARVVTGGPAHIISYKNYILGLYYDASGSIREVTGSIEYSASSAGGPPSLSTQQKQIETYELTDGGDKCVITNKVLTAGQFSISHSGSITQVAKISIKYGDNPPASKMLTKVSSSSISFVYHDEFVAPYITGSTSESFSCTPGGVGSSGGDSPSASNVPNLDVMSINTYNARDVGGGVNWFNYNVSGQDFLGDSHAINIRHVKLSNSAQCFEVITKVPEEADFKYVFGTPIVTALGVESVDPIIRYSRRGWGASDPPFASVSHIMSGFAFSADPICWT